MAIYSFTDNSLNKVETTTFNEEGILERQHLQLAIKHQIEVIAPNCLVISEEFSEWSESKRRIDLLAIGKEGNLVVIELKRTESGDHMELQALRYSAMVSILTFSRAIEIYQKYLVSINCEDDAESNLLEFLDWEGPQEDNFALDVRVVLVSSNFSKELTTSVMWLNQRNLDIRCVRLIPYKYQDQILLDVQQIIPLPEAESYQIRIRQQSEERQEARTTSRDYTNYIFQGQTFNKRKLVLAIVQHWFVEHQPSTPSKLLEAFPREIRNGALFIPVEEAMANYRRTGVYQHFLGDGETFGFPDASKYAVSNQWGVGSIDNFIAHAKTMGYEIEEAS